jgi:hypothetical protein
MRQTGIICAAAIVAVQENVGKLEGDHKKAKIFAGILVYLIHMPLSLVGSISLTEHSLETCIVFSLNFQKD